MEDLRDQPYMFSNIAALGTENPCLSFSLFRQWFHPVNPKGEAASPDSLDSHGMNLLMAGHSSLDDSKRKITSSARIGFNLSEPSLTTFQIQALSSNLMKTSLVFYGGYHHPTPVDMANKRLKNPIQSMISVRNHRKHIISPTKHWGGSSKFHHPKHWRTSGVVHHQIRLKPQNHKIPLNSACEVVEHGICINLSTRFLCRHNLHHLLGDLGISFLKIIRFSNPQQRHGEPWWNRMNILHTSEWKCCGNVLGESRVTLRKKNIEKNHEVKTTVMTCIIYMYIIYVLYYVYIYSPPNLEKSVQFGVGFRFNSLSQQLLKMTFDQMINHCSPHKQDKFGHSGHQREIETLQILLIWVSDWDCDVLKLLDMQTSLKFASWIWQHSSAPSGPLLRYPWRYMTYCWCFRYSKNLADQPSVQCSKPIVNSRKFTTNLI